MNCYPFLKRLATDVTLHYANETFFLCYIRCNLALESVVFESMLNVRDFTQCYISDRTSSCGAREQCLHTSAAIYLLIPVKSQNKIHTNPALDIRFY